MSIRTDGSGAALGASLGPREAALLRRALETEGGADLSPGGAFRSRPAEDSVVLSGPDGERRVGLSGLRPFETAVSDEGGTVAFLARDGAGKEVLGRVDASGVRLLGQTTLRSIDLSPDGSLLAGTSVYEVQVVDAEGTRTLARLPYPADRLEYLEDGRLLALAMRDSWSTGTPIPLCWLVGPDGSVTAIERVEEAERLGLPVRKALLARHQALFPGASPAESEAFVDGFGYAGPRYRGLSPDRRRAVFEVEGGGVHLYRMGGGEPLPLPGAAGLSVYGCEWSGDRAAVYLAAEGREGRVAVGCEEPRRSRLLELPVGREGSRPALAWSPDGARLAVQVSLGGRSEVHVYDVEADAFYPVAGEARLEGWQGDRIAVVDERGRPRLVEAAPMDPARARDYLVGSRPGQEPPRTITVEDRRVVIDEVDLPRS